MVGEHFNCVEGRSARATGATGRENVGMSNRNPDENSGPRKSKVSSAMEVSGGLGDPKAMAKAGVEGKSVNIPTRPFGSTE